MSHTPGPWKIRKEVRKYYNSTTGEPMDLSSTWIEPKEGVHVALVNQSSKTIEADANLIATAPDMLEALEEVYDTFGDDHPVYHRVANIIKKARGEK